MNPRFRQDYTHGRSIDLQTNLIYLTLGLSNNTQPRYLVNNLLACDNKHRVDYAGT